MNPTTYSTTNRSTISHPIDGDTQKIKEHITKIQELLDSGVPVYMGSTAFSYDVANNLGYDAKTGFVIDGFTGKPYNKIVFDPNSRTIKQPDTGVVVPLSGRWMLELFQNFKVQYIGSFENDDWHRNSVLDGRFIEALFKITE